MRAVSKLCLAGLLGFALGLPAASLAQVTGPNSAPASAAATAGAPGYHSAFQTQDHKTRLEERRRKRRAEQAVSLIKSGRCEDALRLADNARDAVMAANIGRLCAAQPKTS